MIEDEKTLRIAGRDVTVRGWRVVDLEKVGPALDDIVQDAAKIGLSLSAAWESLSTEMEALSQAEDPSAVKVSAEMERTIIDFTRLVLRSQRWTRIILAHSSTLTMEEAGNLRADDAGEMLWHIAVLNGRVLGNLFSRLRPAQAAQPSTPDGVAIA